MAKVAVINLGAHGHVNVTLPVVGELVRRGADVTYFVTEEFREAVQSEGARFEGYDSLFSRTPPAPGITVTQLMAQIPAKLTSEALHVLPQLEERLRTLKPDVVLYDNFCLAARLLTRDLGLKAATFLPTYAGNDHFNLGQLVPADQKPSPDDPAYLPFHRDAKIIHDRFGIMLNGTPDLFGHREPLNLCFVAKEFQYRGETFGEEFQFVGPCIAKRPTHGTWDDGGDKRPLVFVSLGTVFNAWPEFFTMCFTAFAGAPYRVLMAVGKQVDPALLGDRPENVEVTAYAPQLEVLEKARAFVSHGGMNSTMEALWFGVPMVVIPQMMEQAATARRVDELGLGTAFTRETITADKLRHAVDAILEDEATRDRVAQMQRAVRASGGQVQAASLVLDYAQKARLASVLSLEIDSRPELNA